MLIGIIGDIHGNIEALDAVLACFDDMNVKSIYCAGDIVGYGASPAECIETIRAREIPSVCGNHDYYTAFFTKYDRRLVREEANRVVLWNQHVLADDQKQWLASLPMSLDTEDFHMTHASCLPYPRWSYVASHHYAAMHMLFQTRKLCFTAHSHIPSICTHIPKRKPLLRPFHDTRVGDSRFTMIGVGAVGQPRDRDPRACSILFDTASKHVTMLRVQYDIQSAQRKILDNGLPPFLAERLEMGV